MHVIERIESASIQGSIRVAAPSWMPTTVTAAAAPTGRVVVVPNEAIPLLAQAGIVPPAQAGEMLDVRDVDARLTSARLSNAERIQTKNALANAGLLRPGRPIPGG